VPYPRLKWQASLISVILFVVIWTNLGWFGRMPVGGDSSRFGLGLMADLSQAITQYRIPLWNSLWGYGFPALAESQLGVFYPPHIILYKCLPLETAYTFDMALHAVWAAVGAWLMARQLGRSPAASALAAITWVSSGFFLVHEPHHWGWTTGSWLPWIFLAGLKLIQSNPSTTADKFKKTLILAGFIAMPVLTGHFQLGFIAMVSLGIFWLATIVTLDKTTNTLMGWRGAPYLLAAFAIALALTMAQVLPTWDLAQQANQQRDWEYLSGFAAPPTHLMGLIVPALGRTVTFWRPLIWDQFHTSPEELFFYVGLVPLWLCLVAIFRKFRHDPSTKALTITLFAVLLLAAGPYIPGFSLLIRLPGFSFFRAPARWIMPATFIMALLASQGLEIVMEDPSRARKSLKRFCLASLFLIASTLSLIEISARLTAPRPGQNSLSMGMINQARSVLMPAWADRQLTEDWVRRSRSTEAASIPAYAKPYTNLALTNFNRDRPAAYFHEVLPQVALLLTLFAGSCLTGSSRTRMATCLMLVIVADLFLVSGLRSIETAPMQDIATQSPVLNRLRSLSINQDWPLAIWGDLGNLPMAVGASPLRAYRTLDIPVMPAINDRLMQSFDEKALAVSRLAGVGVIVFDPPTWSILRGKWNANATIEEINDPELWAWLTTKALARKGSTTFAVVTLNQPLGRAWKVSLDDLAKQGITEPASATSPSNLDRLAELASPLPVKRPVPEQIVIQDSSKGNELWMIAQWADPSWKAQLTNDQGQSHPTDIIALEGGWQGVMIPSPGIWTLKFNYKPASATWGMRISSLSWILLITVSLCLRLPRLSANQVALPESPIKTNS
jgi:hypothetical protein